MLIGNLYLRGGGDPCFGSAPGRPRSPTGSSLDEGLREVTGRVVGDESAFDSLRGTPSEGYRTTSEVGPLSALTFNRGRSGKRRPYFQVNPARFAAREFDRGAAPPRRGHRRRAARPAARRRRR